MRSDALLLQSYARTQDAEAFNELIQRYAPMVHGVSVRILGNAQDAEDIAQECFLEMARSAARITTSLPGWLHRVATFRAYSRIRSSVRRRVREEAAADTLALQESSPWEKIAPQVDHALDALPDELREVLVLHFLQGVSQVDVAKRLGVNQSTVSRRISHGVGELRSHLRAAGVTAGLAVLGTLLSQNVCAASVVPAGLQAVLGKMALAGIGAPLPPAIPWWSTEAARVAAMGVAAAASLGVLVYGLWPAPIEPLEIDRRLEQARAAALEARAVDGADSVAAGGWGVASTARVAADALAGDLSAGGSGDGAPSGLARQGGAAAFGVGAAGAVRVSPAAPGETGEAPPVGAAPGASGGTADGPGATAAGSGGGAARAGDRVAGRARATGATDLAAEGPNVLASRSAAALAAAGASVLGGTGAGAAGGESGGAGAVAVHNFAFTAGTLWAFTDKGMMGYDWQKGAWLDPLAGQGLGTPTKVVSVDADGNVVVSVEVENVRKTSFMGRVEVK